MVINHLYVMWGHLEFQNKVLHIKFHDTFWFHRLYFFNVILDQIFYCYRIFRKQIQTSLLNLWHLCQIQFKTKLFLSKMMTGLLMLRSNFVSIYQSFRSWLIIVITGQSGWWGKMQPKRQRWMFCLWLNLWQLERRRLVLFSFVSESRQCTNSQ